MLPPGIFLSQLQYWVVFNIELLYRQKQIQQIAVLLQCTIRFSDCWNISRTFLERHVSVASTRLNQPIPGAAMGCSCGLSRLERTCFWNPNPKATKEPKWKRRDSFDSVENAFIFFATGIFSAFRIRRLVLLCVGSSFCQLPCLSPNSAWA